MSDNIDKDFDATQKVSHYLSYRRCLLWLWPTMLAISMLLTVLLVSYDARLFDRLSKKWETKMSGFLNVQFEKKNFNLLLNQTIADLNDRKILANSGSDYSRLEKWVRGLINKIKQNADLNHSHALLAFGIATINSNTNSPACVALEKYCALNYSESGKLTMDLDGLDGFTVGSVFLDMYNQTGQVFYKAGARKMARYLVESYPKNKLGAMPYWVDKPNIMLVDDKGMVCGFLIRYGVQFGDAEAVNLGVRQMRTFLEHGINNLDGLPFHGYDIDTDRKFGPNTWGRGIGWLAMGLADTVANLPIDHEARPKFANALTLLLNTLRQYQDSDGCWRWDVNNPMAQLDTSCTAMIGCAIERAIRAGTIDLSWKTLSENALRGILQHTHKNGMVDQALADCNGVGHYPCSFGPSNHAQGTTLALFALVQQRISGGQSKR